MKELQTSLESERVEFLKSIQSARNGLVEKDLQINKLENALEQACSRSVALEDEVAKLKLRSTISISQSPAVSSSAPVPRMSIVSSTGSTVDTGAIFQRNSFSGTNTNLPLPTMTSLHPPRLSGSGFTQLGIAPSHVSYSSQPAFTFHAMNR
jgi:hypothetical protein